MSKSIFPHFVFFVPFVVSFYHFFTNSRIVSVT